MLELVSPETLGFHRGALERVGDHLQARYIAPQKIPGSITLVARGGRACLLDIRGQRDRERGTPMTEDTLFRIYSMTKPITSIAMMTLLEKGLFSLDDPVHRYIPQWQGLEVWSGGAYPQFATTPPARPMTIRDLFMHTSGLTYEFMRATNIDYAYRKLQVGLPRPGYTLEQMIDDLAGLPLEFSPGQRWNYSVSTDVLGYLIQVISGQSLETYLQEVIFDPLGMHDTSFDVSPDSVARFASAYERDANKQLVLQDDGQASRFRNRGQMASGGGGLISTVGDYYRFCQMLLGGGQLDGHRVIGSRTLRHMVSNHLPDGADMTAFATGSFSESSNAGVGFGLGFATKIDPVRNGHAASAGTFYWGGMASTLFWVDPAEELIVIFMTQLIPSSTFNFRGQLEDIIYGALA